MSTMAAPISHAGGLDLFITLELLLGWIRGLLEPLSGSFQSDNPSGNALFEALTGSKSDLIPTSDTVIFTYLTGYDPGTDRLTGSKHQLSIKYVTEQDAFEIRAAPNEGLVEIAPDVHDRLGQAIPRIEREMDHRRRFRVTFLDVHGLRQQGVDSLSGEYESLDVAVSATETELANIPYVADGLAPEVIEAAEQLDGTVPDAPGDRMANRVDDPLVVDTNNLCPFSDLFKN